MNFSQAIGLATLAGAALIARPAAAQDTAPPKAVTVTATIGGVSDYRFRGVSLSGEEPAVQGSIEAAHESGFYGGVWASTLGDSGGADVEVDLYGGWAGDVGSAAIDVGVLGYVYPDGSDLDYLELYGSAGWSLGPATATLGVNYAPDQKNVGSRDNFYIYGDLSAGIPATPVTLRAHLGYEDGPFAGPDGDKVDWSLGADYALGAFTIGAAYVDTDLKGIDEADAAVVLSLTASF